MKAADTVTSVGRLHLSMHMDAYNTVYIGIICPIPQIWDDNVRFDGLDGADCVKKAVYCLM